MSHRQRQLMPHILGSNYYDLWDYPQDLLGQDFGVPAQNSSLAQRNPGNETGLSSIRNDPQNFQVNLDVHHFKPEELTVKHVDDAIIVTGKHQERTDEHGFVSREFTRRYVLPQEVDVDKVACSFNNNTLTIMGPKKAQQALAEHERVIPINTADHAESLAQLEGGQQHHSRGHGRSARIGH